MRWLLLALVAVGCKKDAPPPEPATSDVPVMPQAEVKRSQDACKAYVDQICACADKVAAVKQQCELARALPEAMQVSLDVAANPESKRRDALQAQDAVRKIVKECIEETAKLPSLGCS